MTDNWVMIVSHIEFELPNDEGRRKILKKLISDKLPLGIDEEGNRYQIKKY